jgi:hypothetical protein
MANASPFFKKELGGGLEISEERLKRIVIQEPNYGAFRYILNVLHTTVQGDLQFEPPQGEDLYQIAVVAHRHSFQSGLFYARQWWLQFGFNGRSKHPMPLWYLLWSAYFFDDDRWFFKLSGNLMQKRKCTLPRGAVWETLDLLPRKAHCKDLGPMIVEDLMVFVLTSWQRRLSRPRFCGMICAGAIRKLLDYV